MKLIYYRNPENLIDYLLGWLTTIGYILDGLIGVLTFGLCFGDFSYRASLLQAIYRLETQTTKEI